MWRGPRQYLTSSDLRPARVAEDATWNFNGTHLQAAYPCCEGDAKFHVAGDSAAETYTRKCPRCSTQWAVTRRSTWRDVIRIDRLEWQTRRVEIHAKNRRALLSPARQT